uniref:Uncharacterized protein n=1 Tax=Anguilla anguilla TaxID=7936 RepID=A0A0E9X1K5_ANGAN
MLITDDRQLPSAAFTFCATFRHAAIDYAPVSELYCVLGFCVLHHTPVDEGFYWLFSSGSGNRPKTTDTRPSRYLHVSPWVTSVYI